MNTVKLTDKELNALIRVVAHHAEDELRDLEDAREHGDPRTHIGLAWEVVDALVERLTTLPAKEKTK